jgi:hypothetical protein
VRERTGCVPASVLYPPTRQKSTNPVSFFKASNSDRRLIPKFPAFLAVYPAFRSPNRIALFVAAIAGPRLINHNGTAKDGAERIAVHVCLQDRLPSGADKAHETGASLARHDPACILYVEVIEGTIEVHEIVVHNRRRTRRGCTERRTECSNVASVAQRDPISKSSVIPASQLILNPRSKSN